MDESRKVFVQSFGCRASQADGAAIEASLEAHGFARANDAAHADLVVVNTCTVTQSAEIDARRAIRGLRRDFPRAEILVTGCYAQRAPEEVASIEGVRWVAGNSHKNRIAEIVSDNCAEYHGQIYVSDIRRETSFTAAPVVDTREDRTRPNIKVQDGCSNKCAFCIIPSVRGRSRSASLKSVVEQVRDLADRYCEVVLTGINLGRWGRELEGRLRFADLVRAILGETAVQRIRISSIEPMDWSDELLELMSGEPRIAQHVHIPLQSGSDAVLKRMFRKYRTRHYAGRLEAARTRMPDAAIGADVMTGFPGESDAEFEETLRFVEEQPFTYLHVFTYSERPGTVASEMPIQVPVHMRRERTRVLRELSERKNLQFRQRMLGKTLSAVTLERAGFALTTNFLNVELVQRRASNQMIHVHIGLVSNSGLTESTPFPILASRDVSALNVDI